jgi:hypothetical protein
LQEQYHRLIECSKIMTDRGQGKGHASPVQKLIDAGIPVRTNIVHKIERPVWSFVL